jgi:hypothetical protein
MMNLRASSTFSPSWLHASRNCCATRQSGVGDCRSHSARGVLLVLHERSCQRLARPDRGDARSGTAQAMQASETHVQSTSGATFWTGPLSLESLPFRLQPAMPLLPHPDPGRRSGGAIQPGSNPQNGRGSRMLRLRPERACLLKRTLSAPFAQSSTQYGPSMKRISTGPAAPRSSSMAASARQGRMTIGKRHPVQDDPDRGSARGRRRGFGLKPGRETCVMS